MSSVSGTVSIIQANVLARGLVELGYDPEPIFKSAGLKLSSETDPTERIGINEFVGLGKACEHHTGDPAIVHKLYRQIRLAYLDSFGVSLLYSSDLLEFLKRFQKYLPYAISRASIDIFDVDEGYFATCNWNLGLSDSDQQSVTEWFSCAFIGMCSEVLGEDLKVDRVLLEFKPSPAMLEVIETHARSIERSQEQYGFVFSHSTMSQRLPLASPQLAQMAEQMTLQYLDTIETENIALRVERKIIEGLADGDFTKENVARSLGMSVSSLYDRLAQEETSYSGLLESARKERAIQYLHTDMLRVSQIAYALGFQSPSNFSRAFKSWTGMSPGEYRSKLTS